MKAWEEYPDTYREAEVGQISRAICTGECAAIIGLSGSGKSNLMLFLAHRVLLPAGCPRMLLVDCNRLAERSAEALYEMLRSTVEKLKPGTGPSRAFDGEATEPTQSPGGAGMDEVQALPARRAPEVKAFQHLEWVLESRLTGMRGICLLLDRFDALSDMPEFPSIAGNLRALRDAYKYQLMYVTAARRPLDPSNELAELFFGHTVWLGPLSKDDALWSAARDARRFSDAKEISLNTSGQDGEIEDILRPGNRVAPGWPPETLEKLVEISGGYPSLLRAACEAYADGAELSTAGLGAHPAVKRRAAELWSDRPDRSALRMSGLDRHPWIRAQEAAVWSGMFEPGYVSTGPDAETVDTLSSVTAEGGQAIVDIPSDKIPGIDTTELTAKEYRLLEALRSRAGQVCEKDDLVRAIWPEDVIFAQGIRDESLAQLVRRLRVKIEPDPAEPTYIHTVAGRGYIFKG